MSNIYATRRGFLYQDRYAVLQFLQFLQAKQIEQFYVDFVFDAPNKKSIDIKIVLEDGSTKITEVKTGQNFKRDARTSDTSQVKDAFTELHNCSNGDATIQKHLVLSPDFQGIPKVFEYWQKLIILKGTPTFRSPEAKRIAKWFYLKLGFPRTLFPTHESLYDFLKSIQIFCSHSDTTSVTDDYYPDIDDAAIQIIRDLSHTLECDGTEQELPCSLLFHQLLYTCQKNAGTNTDFCEDLIENVLTFFASRRMIDRTHSGDYPTAYASLRREYVAWKAGVDDSTISVNPVPNLTEISEGGTTHD